MEEGIARDIFVKNKGMPELIDYVQGTNAIPLIFHFRDWEIPSGATARIFIKKPSGKEVYNSAAVSGDTVTVKPTTQMFAESGVQEGQIQIMSGSTVLDTFLLVFRVERNIVSGSAIESTDEYAILDGLINDAREAAELANQKAQAAQNAAEYAGEAAENANTKASACETVTQEAHNAASSANSAAQSAKDAEKNADTAADEAAQAAKDAKQAAKAAQKVVDEWNSLEDASRVTALEEAVGKIKETLKNLLSTE